MFNWLCRNMEYKLCRVLKLRRDTGLQACVLEAKPRDFQDGWTTVLQLFINFVEINLTDEFFESKKQWSPWLVSYIVLHSLHSTSWISWCFKGWTLNGSVWFTSLFVCHPFGLYNNRWSLFLYTAFLTETFLSLCYSYLCLNPLAPINYQNLNSS